MFGCFVNHPTPFWDCCFISLKRGNCFSSHTQIQQMSKIVNLSLDFKVARGVFEALRDTVDGSEIRHQLRLVVYPHYFTRFLHHPNGGWEWDFWTIKRMVPKANSRICVWFAEGKRWTLSMWRAPPGAAFPNEDLVVRLVHWRKVVLFGRAWPHDICWPFHGLIWRLGEMVFIKYLQHFPGNLLDVCKSLKKASSGLVLPI